MALSSAASIQVLLADGDGTLQSTAQALFEDGRVAPTPGGGCRLDQVLWRLEQHPADLVVLDLGDAWEEGFRCIEDIMAARPTPMLVLHRLRADVAPPFHALALGALDLLQLEGRPTPEFWRALVPKMLLLAQVRVVKHVKGTRRRPNVSANPDSTPVVAIASSLGGPKALSVLLRALPKGFRAPIFVCQHISDGFTEGMARWLSTETGQDVKEAQEGEHVTRGVRIAPSGVHLLLRADGTTALDEGPPRQGFRPSCDALLSSAAESFGSRCIGVVLTGMGRDGAQGLLEIRRRGGRTVVQDQATSVAYGMPGEAVLLGAAERVEPIERIAPLLADWVRGC